MWLFYCVIRDLIQASIKSVYWGKLCVVFTLDSILLLLVT